VLDLVIMLEALAVEQVNFLFHLVILEEQNLEEQVIKLVNQEYLEVLVLEILVEVVKH
jgi:hypothetical protein